MAVTTTIYGGGPFYNGGDAVVTDLKQSGFTTVLAWTVHVQPNGDLHFNNTPLVTGGRYVGDPTWPERLQSLLEPPTSVTRLLIGVGSGGAGDFGNIQTLIAQGGNQPGGALYKAFATLRAALPAVAGVDFDDEDLYDQPTVVTFAQMLASIGYPSVTFCPYADPDFWTGCLATLERSNPGFVAGFNLQCYDGGARNDPGDWVAAIHQVAPHRDAPGMVFPGLWCRNDPQKHTPPQCEQGSCPADVEAQFAAWKAIGIAGGFIWLYDDIQYCDQSGACGGATGSTAYASAIAEGLGSATALR